MPDMEKQMIGDRVVTYEDQTAETTCSGFCDDPVTPNNSVAVVVGSVVGEWDTPRPHVGVEDVDGGAPEIELWCTDCSASKFDVDQPAGVRDRVTQSRWVPTIQTVTRILAGAIGAYFVFAVVSV